MAQNRSLMPISRTQLARSTSEHTMIPTPDWNHVPPRPASAHPYPTPLRTQTSVNTGAAPMPAFDPNVTWVPELDYSAFDNFEPDATSGNFYSSIDPSLREQDTPQSYYHSNNINTGAHLAVPTRPRSSLSDSHIGAYMYNNNHGGVDFNGVTLPPLAGLYDPPPAEINNNNNNNNTYLRGSGTTTGADHELGMGGAHFMPHDAFPSTYQRADATDMLRVPVPATGHASWDGAGANSALANNTSTSAPRPSTAPHITLTVPPPPTAPQGHTPGGADPRARHAQAQRAKRAFDPYSGRPASACATTRPAGGMHGAGPPHVHTPADPAPWAHPAQGYPAPARHGDPLARGYAAPRAAPPLGNGSSSTGSSGSAGAGPPAGPLEEVLRAGEAGKQSRARGAARARQAEAKDASKASAKRAIANARRARAPGAHVAAEGRVQGRDAAAVEDDVCLGLPQFHATQPIFYCRYGACTGVGYALDTKEAETHLLNVHKLHQRSANTKRKEDVPRFKCAWPGCEGSKEVDRKFSGLSIMRHVLTHGENKYVCDVQVGGDEGSDERCKRQFTRLPEMHRHQWDAHRLLDPNRKDGRKKKRSSK